MSLIIILTGPSGSGKTTLSEHIVSEYGFIKPTTYTTRKPRSEENNESYCFITEDEFKLKISRDEMAEYVENFGNYYGCEKTSFTTEKNIAIALDYRGAKSIKTLYPTRSIIIYLSVSKEMMLLRINKRSKITEDQIEKRIKESEVTLECKFDYMIDANEEIHEAKKKINSIVSNLVQEKKLARC